MREAARTTTFEQPSDEQWDESPRGWPSRLSRSLGWTLLCLWLVALVGFGLWRVAVEQSPWAQLVVFGFLSGMALLFSSILLDRLRVLKTDRYRRIRR